MSSQFENLNTIIGNGKSYRVPIYQRDYSWTKDDWEDLWNDILDLEIDNQHYLGYLVLQQINKTEQIYEVIDGQQRLTTVSLLALAVIAILKKWAEEGIESELNELRRQEEIRRYIGNVDTSGTANSTFLPILPKLILNRNNDDYYKSYLLNLRTPTAINKLKPSVKLLQKSFDFFYTKLEDKFGQNKLGAEITHFLEKTIGNGLVFTIIEVQNDLDAFKVFETVNARGVKLSPADLLKNYLFSQAAKKGQIDLDEAERRWQNIVNTLANNDVTTYIRHYWNSKYKLKRQPELFKAIKNEVTDADKAFHLFNSLEKQAVFYKAFDTPFDEDIWSNEERKHLQVLNLLEVTTCNSLMLAFLENCERKDFHILLREISVISLRYNISQLNPNEAERLYSSVANQVYSKNLIDVRSIVTALKNIYVEDDSFEQAFSKSSINTRRKKNLVKYILIKLENQISNTDYQFEEASASIEHILPENPGSNWDTNFSPEIQDEFIYRIGNYTLLSKSTNNKLDNEKSFLEKLESYKLSKYKLSSEYCLYDDFNPSALQLRQNRMAKIAKGIWKSAFIK
ncbi:MAG: DUF262 domain-containing protein [Chitinophagales bacterium]|nr:DUF262 domain-containing protein [Chitinophagales bacterium]